jgi:NodT family efflux transporter outer membrane factor (OMF) lipoprotein
MIPNTLTTLATIDSEGIAAGEGVDPLWWTGFGDPQLTTLIEQALVSNYDLQAAASRIEEARAFRQTASALGRPQVEADGNGQRIRSSENARGFGPPPGLPFEQNLYELGVSASWELDLFGRAARRREAADARVEVSVEDRRGLVLLVIAETASAYADMRNMQTRTIILQENEVAARRTLDATVLLTDRGLGSELDVVRARAELDDVRATIPPLLARERAAIASLAALTGRLPGELSGSLEPLGAAKLRERNIPIGLPSTLLRRRPDVRLAERRLAAETADIGAEIADLYPRFSLTGMIGLTSAIIGNLLNSGSDTFAFGGVMNWPLFSGGRERAEVDAARSGADVARAQYQAAVIEAFSDVEKALTTYVFARERRRRLVDTQANRSRTFELAELRYSAGLDDVFAVLETQRRLLGARDALAEADGEVLRSTVDLYRALGGGWEAGDQAAVSLSPIETSASGPSSEENLSKRK